MKKLSTSVAIALTFAGNVALADDSSMSRWTGDSYAAIQADKGRVAATRVAPRGLTPIDDNSMSRWHGDSHAAFERERTSPSRVTISIAEANRARAQAGRSAPLPRASRGASPTNPFRDDTAA
jgi:hypothetical protein